MTEQNSHCIWDIMSVGKQHLFLFPTMLVLAVLFTTQTQAKLCTRLRSVQKEVNAYNMVMCTEAYQARCSWFSFKMCTFYEKVPCKNQKNETRVQYKIVTECCKGYIRDSDNLTCIRELTEAGARDVTIITISDETTVISETTGVTESIKGSNGGGNTVNISHGAFAAITSAGFFVVCVTIVIIIHVRKKQLREEKANKETATPVELQKMVHA